jgi:chromosome segregation ATPase
MLLTELSNEKAMVFETQNQLEAFAKEKALLEREISELKAKNEVSENRFQEMLKERERQIQKEKEMEKENEKKENEMKRISDEEQHSQIISEYENQIQALKTQLTTEQKKSSVVENENSSLKTRLSRLELAIGDENNWNSGVLALEHQFTELETKYRQCTEELEV